MDISECQDLTSISHAAMCLLQENHVNIPKPVKTIRSSLSKEPAEEGKREGCELFGIPLMNEQEKEVMTLDKNIPCSLPKFFADSVSYLEDYVSIEGLFRKSGSVARQREIRSKIEEGGEFPENRPHDVAALLKSFLRQLPEPLMTRRFGQVFVECGSCSSPDLVLTACLLLPVEHLQCLQVLMRFLKKVATESSVNKMDTTSLAVVLTPNLFDLTTTGERQGDLTAFTSVVKSLIMSADDIGHVPPTLADRAQELSEEFEGNLPPLLLTYIAEEDNGNLCSKRTRRPRTRKKSASFSDIMKGLGNSISRLRRTSPRRGTSTPPREGRDQEGEKEEGEVSVSRKDSVKRRAECVSTGSTAKRRAVHDSPPTTPLPATKVKKKRSFFKRKSNTEKAKRNAKRQGVYCSSSATPLLKGGDSCFSSEFPTASSGHPTPPNSHDELTPSTELSTAEVDTEKSPEKETQSKEIAFSPGDKVRSPAHPRYLYQMVTSDGTVVRCLSKGDPTKTIKYSEVKRQKACHLPPSISANNIASSASSQNCTPQIHPAIGNKFGKNGDSGNCIPSGTKCHYYLRSSSNVPQSSLLPSKMPVPNTSVRKSKSEFSFAPSPAPYSASSRNCQQPYDFSPFVSGMRAAESTWEARSSGSGSDRRDTKILNKRRSHSMKSESQKQRKKTRPVDRSHSTPTTTRRGTSVKRESLTETTDFKFSVPENKENVHHYTLTLSDQNNYQFSLPEAKDARKLCTDRSPETKDILKPSADHVPQDRNVVEFGTTYLPEAQCEWGSRSSLSQDCCFQPPSIVSAAAAPDLLEEISMEILVRKRGKIAEEKSGLLSTQDPFLLSCASGVSVEPSSTSSKHNWFTSSYPPFPSQSSGAPCVDEHCSHTVASSRIPDNQQNERFQHITSFSSPNISIHSLPSNHQLGINGSHSCTVEDGLSGRSPSKFSGISPSKFVRAKAKRFGNHILKSPIVGVTNLMTSYAKNSHIRQISREWLV